MFSSNDINYILNIVKPHQINHCQSLLKIISAGFGSVDGGSEATTISVSLWPFWASAQKTQDSYGFIVSHQQKLLSRCPVAPAISIRNPFFFPTSVHSASICWWQVHVLLQYLSGAKQETKQHNEMKRVGMPNPRDFSGALREYHNLYRTPMCMCNNV